MDTAHSPFPRHEDVTVSLPDGTLGVYRVVEMTPYDLTLCADAYGRLVASVRREQSFSSLAMSMFASAFECVVCTARPIDASAKKHGVREVRDYASARRLCEAFLRLNLLSEEAQGRVGKIMASTSEMLTDLIRVMSTNASTSSSGSATPSPTPVESPSVPSPA